MRERVGEGESGSGRGREWERERVGEGESGNFVRCTLYNQRPVILKSKDLRVPERSS